MSFCLALYVENIYGLQCYSCSVESTDSVYLIGDARYQCKDSLITCPAGATRCVVSFKNFKTFTMKFFELNFDFCYDQTEN